MNKFGLAALGIAASASAQTHTGTFAIQHTSGFYSPGETATFAVFAQWDSPAFIDGLSATAGFGFDIVTAYGLDNVASMSNLQYADWAAGFGVGPDYTDTSILNISGGQLANLFGILNPGINMNNPIELFTFDVTWSSGPLGVTEIATSNPNINGGLSFYPDSQDGASIIAPNDPDTELVMGSIIFFPAPGTAAPLLMMAMIRRRR
jgi:hypothetical protein